MALIKKHHFKLVKANGEWGLYRCQNEGCGTETWFRNQPAQIVKMPRNVQTITNEDLDWLKENKIAWSEE
jgi:hypothetical protein